MILLRWGRWSHCAGRFLIWTRIFVKGYRWTPFCCVRKRYASWLGYWGR